MKLEDPRESVRADTDRRYLRSLPNPLDASREGPDAVARLWIESILTNTPPETWKAKSRLWNNPLFGIHVSVASGPETTRFFETLLEYRRVWRQTKGDGGPLLRLWFFIARDTASRHRSILMPRYRGPAYYRALRRLLTAQGIDPVETLEREFLRVEPKTAPARSARPEIALTDRELYGVQTVRICTAAIRSLQRSAKEPIETRIGKAAEAIGAEAETLGWEKLGVRMAAAHVLEFDLRNLIGLIAKDKKRHGRGSSIRVAIEECSRKGIDVPTEPAEWRALQKRYRDQLRTRTKPPPKT